MCRKVASERRMNANVDEEIETKVFFLQVLGKFNTFLFFLFFENLILSWKFLFPSTMNKTTASSAFLRSSFPVAKVLRNSSLLICKKISSATIYGTTCYCSCYVERYRSPCLRYRTICNCM